jgi:signal transduction histidine kinase
MAPSSSLILFVDDEPANLGSFKFCFEDRFEIATASSGEQALAIMATQQVAVLLTDQRMPDMSGTELCIGARERHPEVVRMIVTAYADLEAAIAAINAGQVRRFILKPWREEQMAEFLRAGIAEFEFGAMMRIMQSQMLEGGQQATASLLGAMLQELSEPASALHADVHFVANSIRGLAAEPLEGTSVLRTRLRELNEVAQMAARAIEELVERIRRFPDGEAAEKDAILHSDVNHAVEAAVAVLGPELRKHARVDLRLGAVEPVIAQPTQLTQVIVNLLRTAVEPISLGCGQLNTITVRTRQTADLVVLEVENTGQGIVPEALAPIFDPVIATKSDDTERGLRLAVVRNLVQRLPGTIRMRNDIGRGTCFVIELRAAR